MRKIIQITVTIITVLSSLSIYAQSTQDGFNQIDYEITDSIYSKTLNSYRHFWVKLPENYNPKSKAKYPVIYLLDGFSLKSSLEVVYDNYWGHYMPHMILVGISNRKNRTRNLTISKIENRRGATMQNESGGAEQFTTFIETDLMPYIDKTFQTSRYRTLIGHSYAGLFTINVLLKHSHLFNNYIAIDPSLDWDGQKLLKEAKVKLKSKSFKGKSLFVAFAAEQLHMSDDTVTIDNLMENTSEFTLFPRSIVEFSEYASAQKQNGLQFSWKVYPEDLHGTVPLPAIRDGLVAVFKWYQFKSPQTYNNPETSIEDLIESLKNQEEIYKNHFGYVVPPMVEELFVGYGHMYFQTDQKEKAKLFLNKAIEYYPNKTLAYEMLADYFESVNDIENAIKHLNIAYNINRDEQLKRRIEALSQN
ncbi:alpha/beta hydrolase-fold protein [Psychroserpens ponticola]|uniref:Alpha/beta hydrolase-fold protein n=1 Tax=Psychroserpens ponticola TaxID=2932268 RepID=A0ABY7RTK6_9FLAO|nr:alpha/beta hydrolase-fold protein [Psychroserpens ponticola]WCO00442.1 alpha/beta hydrolase-fold protein [Psychroserpens ponticola]